MNKNQLTARRGAIFVIGFCSVVLVGTTLSLSACSMGDPEPDQEATLEGRYAITSASGSGTFSTLWFAKDGTFEAVLAKCTSNCVRSGSFTLAHGDLTLMPTEGPVSKLRIDPGTPAGGLTTDRVATRTTGDDSAPLETAASTSDCKSTASRPMSLTQQAEGGPGSGQTVALLSGCASTLQNVLTEFSAGQEGKGQRAGDLPPSKIPEVAKSICGWGTSCKRYTCWQCSGSDTGGCKVGKGSGCEYLCPGWTESRCTGWMDSNFMRECGTGDGCGRYE